MMPAKSRQLGMVLVAMAAVGALVWALGVWSSARSAAASAAGDLATCQRLAGEISVLREQPLQAQAASLQEPEMARNIEQAADQAHIDKRDIERITPGEPHRVKDSVFMETPTQIKLQRVTVAQLVPFLHRLSVSADGGRNLRVDAVRLAAPRGTGDADSGDTWSAEITVCYLVYTPRDQPSLR